MLQELKFQLSTALLTVVTAAAVIAAALNFQQLHRFHLPDDGVIWVDRAGNGTTPSVVVAKRIASGSGADHAGLRVGDVLVRINSVAIDRSQTAARVLFGLGTWRQYNFTISRRGVEVTAPVLIEEAPRDRALFFQYITAFAYIAIGLFVWARRGSAYKSRHFYLFCLASFIFSAFHYTGKLNPFDWIIYWGNVIAGLLAPALLLHFCLTFPEVRPWFRPSRHAWIIYLVPAAILTLYLGFSTGFLGSDSPPVDVRYALDRASAGLLAAYYALCCVFLTTGYRNASDPTTRHQLKWLRNGLLCGFLPFAIFYLAPFLLGQIPAFWMRASVVSLALIPLTIAYAVIRYRLMDVDVIFRRGFAYTAATVCVLAAFYGVVFSLASFAQKNFKDLGSTGLLTVMLITAFLFQPLRNWIQERLDKFFYQEKYDYRRTLIEFARELNVETNLDRMLTAVGDRVMQTLSVRHLAFFLLPESENLDSKTFEMRKTMGSGGRNSSASPLDLSFLHWTRETPYFFFERSRLRFDAVTQSWPASVRSTLAALDLTYYLPCNSRGRTVAYLGVSRSESGEFLSSDDVDLLFTLCGYVGIAIENATLYQALQQKANEYERLKEFSENIVESISVGILAADLEDRVESWNTRMEELTGVSRETALGRKLEELFPGTLIDRLEPLREESGIYHIDKFAMRQWGAHTKNGHGGSGEALASNGATPVRDVTFNIAVAPLVSKDMERIGRLVIFDDITDRSELERRLVQADKLSSIGLLAAGVAHEVNTPLAVISTYAQMLTKQLHGDEQKSRMLDKIARQTFRASEIVNSLLNFSRTSSSDTGPVQINRVIQETLSLLEHQLNKAGIDIRLRLNEALPLINGNAGKLQQVFLNLFLNARDAMENCPRGEAVLEVSTGNHDLIVTIDICDTGHGIAPEHLDRIYDPFFTTKGARKGTGLGLSVTYGIMQEHGGAIEAFPRTGKGSRFHLELPLVKKPALAYT